MATYIILSVDMSSVQSILMSGKEAGSVFMLGASQQKCLRLS